MNKNGDEKSKLHILIGRNGTGKSRMLSSLLKHELKKSYSKDSQSFSRFIAVSIAPFDKFPISLNDFFGKYKYLGIKNTSGSTAAKKFIKKVGVDFFEMLASGGNLFHLNKSLTDFGLDPRVEFEMKVSSKVNNPKVNYLNNNEFQNYIYTDFLGEDIWRKIPKNNKTKEIFQTIEQFQIYFQGLSDKYIKECRWLIDSGGINGEDSLIFGGMNFKSISILLSAGLIEITKINIKNNERTIDLCSASSGEQSIYLTLIGIAANIQDNSLVVIDEPETCLHPAWQEKYISIIDIFLRNYSNCSFWIATHSPKIVSGATEDAKIINLETNKTVTNHEFSKKSSDYQLVELFNSPGYKNEYLSKLIVEVIKLLATTVDVSEVIYEKVRKLIAISEYLIEDDPLKEVIKAIEKSIKEKNNATL